MGFDKYMLSCICHGNVIHNSSSALNYPFYLTYVTLPSDLLATVGICTLSIVLPFLECHIIGTILYVTFSNWLLSHRHLM